MDAGAELLAEKRGLRLDRVVLLGRTFEEYRRYFLLKPEELIARDVLDVAGGVSSFCAEANACGIRVISLIPSIRCLRKELRRAPSQISKRFTAPLGTFPSIAGAITRLRNACASFGSAPIPLLCPTTKSP